MRTIETKVYTIDEHPSKDKCFVWIRDNWHDLNQHSFADYDRDAPCRLSADDLEVLRNYARLMSTSLIQKETT